MVARLAAQTREGTSHSTQYSMAPPSSLDGTATLRTQSGACTGRCFSKNDCPSTPSGYRFMVSGRSRTWDSITGAMRA